MTLNLKTVSGYDILDIELHVAFEMYYLFTKIHKNQAEFIRNSENGNVHRIGQDEVKHRKYTRHNVCDDHVYNRSCHQAADAADLSQDTT
jgi:hypothetical protein